jgi:hypothetical protein
LWHSWSYVEQWHIVFAIAFLVFFWENQINHLRPIFGWFDVTPVILEIGESHSCISELLKATNTVLLAM